MNKETQHTPAHLIAAAPYSLEALRALYNQEDREGEYVAPGSPVDLARKAIAKAEGRGA